MKKTYPSPNPSPIGNSSYTSRDDIAEWLKYQEVNQRFQYQRKPRVVSSMIPIRPFHSISIDLIDKSNQPSLVIKNGLVRKSYHYMFVIVDNFSRFSPTHKRTEGRAPVWGSEFTSKRRRTTGGIQQKPL